MIVAAEASFERGSCSEDIVKRGEGRNRRVKKVFWADWKAMI